MRFLGLASSPRSLRSPRSPRFRAASTLFAVAIVVGAFAVGACAGGSGDVPQGGVNESLGGSKSGSTSEKSDDKDDAPSTSGNNGNTGSGTGGGNGGGSGTVPVPTATSQPAPTVDAG